MVVWHMLITAHWCSLHTRACHAMTSKNFLASAPFRASMCWIVSRSLWPSRDTNFLRDTLQVAQTQWKQRLLRQNLMFTLPSCAASDWCNISLKARLSNYCSFPNFVFTHLAQIQCFYASARYGAKVFQFSEQLIDFGLVQNFRVSRILEGKAESKTRSRT